MRKWTLREKKKLIVVLILAALGALFGYIETLIPPVFGSLAHLRVQLGVILALFALLAYGPLEALMVYGVRSVAYGLICDDGYAILLEITAFAVAAVAVWGVMKARKVGAGTHGAVAGAAYAVVYTALGCILPRSGAMWQTLLQTMAFYAVNMGVLGVAAWVALRYLPERLIFDNLE